MAKGEHGAAAAEEVDRGLDLLREAHGLRACYWACPFCPGSDGGVKRFATQKEFLGHVDACHEGVQLGADGRPLLCTSCGLEVSEDLSSGSTCLNFCRVGTSCDPILALMFAAA